MSYESRRRIHRRMYLTQHQAQRRAALKAAGARRIEVTLRGAALDNYLIVCRYFSKSTHQRVITKALDLAAHRILDKDDHKAKCHVS